MIDAESAKVIAATSTFFGAVIMGLKRAGLLSFGRSEDGYKSKPMAKDKEVEWDGKERRECASHVHLSNKVCALFTKIEEIDSKLDSVAEKLQFVLGRLEAEWGKR